MNHQPRSAEGFSKAPEAGSRVSLGRDLDVAFQVPLAPGPRPKPPTAFFRALAGFPGQGGRLEP